RRRDDEMLIALKKSEQSMEPVLHKLHDYVLALKHTLNAQAIASLGGESVKIQADISRLIEDMKASIASVAEFIRQMPKCMLVRACCKSGFFATSLGDQAPPIEPGSLDLGSAIKLKVNAALKERSG